MKTVHHDQISVRALLRLEDHKLPTLYENGKRLTPRQVRLMLDKANSEGKHYLPLGNCADFDFQKGCPGHQVPEHLS